MFPAVRQARDGAPQKTANAGNSGQASSISGKLRFLLRNKGVIGPAEIFRLHADRLRERLRLDCVIKRHRELLVEHGFRHSMREGRTACELLRERHGIRFEFVGGNDAIEKAPALALLRRHDASSIKKLRRAAVADDAWQQGAGAHVAASKPNTSKQKCGLGLRRPEPDVAEQGDHRPRSDAYAVNRRYDGLRAGPHRLHQLTGHPREFQKALHIAARQRPDNVVNVAAGAEVATVRAEHDDLDVVRPRQFAERLPKFGVAFEGDRILPLGALERDHRDTVLGGPIEVFRLKAAHIHARDPPLRMRPDNPSRWRIRVSASAASNSDSRPSTHVSCALAMAVNSLRPRGVSRTMMARRSSAGAWRTTILSDTSRSMMPVTLPFETIRKRDSSVMVMPSGFLSSAAITSNCGSVTSNWTRSRSRTSASIARAARNMRTQSRSRCLLSEGVVCRVFVLTATVMPHHLQ